ncbi:putative high-affinity zinc transporter periplasmic component [Helicobacter pylori R046Wa]|nr:putative high-affinity zinc transporter periplasmic component [Helicobacter pylori R046Wa]
MKKALKILSVSALLFVALNAKDFSKTSDEDLAKMAGVVAP